MSLHTGGFQILQGVNATAWCKGPYLLDTDGTGFEPLGEELECTESVAPAIMILCFCLLTLYFLGRHPNQTSLLSTLGVKERACKQVGVDASGDNTVSTCTAIQVETIWSNSEFLPFCPLRQRVCSLHPTYQASCLCSSIQCNQSHMGGGGGGGAP